MSKIAFVGEAWGADEEILKHPFVGAAGRELIRMSMEAGILPRARVPFQPGDVRDYWLTQPDISLHNVLNLRPPNNDIEALCVSKSDDRSGRAPIKPGKYLRAEYLPEVDRLAGELRERSPRIVVSLGNVPSWALLGSGGITKIRGNITTEQLTNNSYKCLPTFHPAAVLRQWDLRGTTVFDLMKVQRESAFPEVRRPERTIYIDPTLEDMEWFYAHHIQGASLLSIDIETHGEQMTCIGVAPSPRVAMVVPLVDWRKPGNSYWSTADEERRAWEWIARVLDTPTPKLGQNFTFDMQFLWQHYGMPVRNAYHDTMLLHHALQPESKKGLGFLGSIYTNEASWKIMRTNTLKRDE